MLASLVRLFRTALYVLHPAQVDGTWAGVGVDIRAQSVLVAAGWRISDVWAPEGSSAVGYRNSPDLTGQNGNLAADPRGDYRCGVFSVARDAVGNRGVAPSTAQATTRMQAVLYLPLVRRSAQ
jgi:hypothetical protein